MPTAAEPKPKPLPRSTIAVLRVMLAEHDKYHWCTQVATAAGINPGSVSVILRELFATGKISRTQDPGDTRVFYMLTPEGKAWAKQQVKNAPL